MHAVKVRSNSGQRTPCIPSQPRAARNRLTACKETAFDKHRVDTADYLRAGSVVLYWCRDRLRGVDCRHNTTLNEQDLAVTHVSS